MHIICMYTINLHTTISIFNDQTSLQLSPAARLHVINIFTGMKPYGSRGQPSGFIPQVLEDL